MTLFSTFLLSNIDSSLLFYYRFPTLPSDPRYFVFSIGTAIRCGLTISDKILTYLHKYCKSNFLEDFISKIFF